MSTSESIQYRERIERTIDVRGIPTHLFEGGDPTTPPLLYLHGMLNGNLWLDYHQNWPSISISSLLISLALV